MFKKITSLIATLGSISLFSVACGDHVVNESVLTRLYGTKPNAPTENLKVFHLGHSLVGRNMPSMIKQLAGEGHEYAGQIGWGTKMQAHWDLNKDIKGFEIISSQPKVEDVYDAIESGQFDVFVITEGVEIKDAIRYHDSAEYLAKFVRKIKQHNPGAKIYFYETWHKTDDKAGWMNRLASDYEKYWLKEIVYPSLVKLDGKYPIYVIPVGQVMLKLFSEIRLNGGAEGLWKPEDLFYKAEDGTIDKIHVSNAGSYLVALVHYAVLYRRSPIGLPYKLKEENGNAIDPPSAEAAALMQRITWEVVSEDFLTGLQKYTKEPTN